MSNLGKQITIAVVAAALVFGVGYALFSDTITVSGTAGTTGSMNVVVESASVTNSVGAGTTNTASVSGDGKSVTLAVPALQYPGASVTFDIDLKNTGTLGAKVLNIEPTGLGTAEEDLVITYNGLAVNDIIAGNNGTDKVTVTVTWNENSSTGFTGNAFNIVFNFTQNNPS